MKHVYIQNTLIAVLMLSASQSLIAGNDAEVTKSVNAYRSAEVGIRSIKVASDGVGFIQGFSCNDCGFKVLKVTADTKSYLNNVEIGAAKLVKKSKAQVGIVRYALDSNAVYEIRFSR